MTGAAAAPSHGHDLVLGRFRALRPLGAGGSGTVWLARDEKAGRHVALKVVPREGKAGERAEREAHAVARLRSPRCARAYSIARDERHVYVAYEYIPGKTLREAIRAGEVDDATAIEAAAQMLDALSHAHRKGIVHRDVKPANVLLEEHESVSVRVLDFGLAQIDEADTLTAAGDVPGTLAYISPERLAGKAATGAADVWAVGVILWESLAGYQPFWAGSPLETAKLIGSGAPPLRTVRPDLPKEVTTAVDRALAVDPRRRPLPDRLATELRASMAAAAERRKRRPAGTRREVLERSAHAALTAGYAAFAATLFPFYPPALLAGLAFLAALSAFLVPRLGLVLALAVPVLPLGDVSLGLAVAYLPVAALWAALTWGDARRAFLCVAGPVLGFAGALPLVPLVAERARGSARRFAQGAAAVLLAAVVAGMHGAPLPLTGEEPPQGLGIAGSDSPTAVAGALWHALLAYPAIAVEAIVVGAAAALLPHMRRRDLWQIAAFGASLMAASLLAPSLAGAEPVFALPVVLAAWAVCALLAWPTLVEAHRQRDRRDRSGAKSREPASDEPTMIVRAAAPEARTEERATVQ
jgi:tRNA A-37 threonylcarbamoyl transferase component Bud32